MRNCWTWKPFRTLQASQRYIDREMEIAHRCHLRAHIRLLPPGTLQDATPYNQYVLDSNKQHYIVIVDER